MASRGKKKREKIPIFHIKAKIRYVGKPLLSRQGLGSANILTRAWPGSQPNAIDRGGAYNAPPG